MRRFVFALVGVAFAAALTAAPAAARSGPCLAPGVEARCSIWTGKVTYVADGDTFYVDLDGDGTRQTVTVRVTGINTMEQTAYNSTAPSRRRGDCHAIEATARLEQLIRKGGGRVRLAAFDASSASRRRWRRAVAVKLRGRWRDVGRTLVAEGHALWLPNSDEWLWNAGYSTLAERAASARRGLWNPTYCGSGPQDAARLRLAVNGDADGIDGENLNGEWVRIRNLDPVISVHLGGWSLQQSAPGRYVLPDWVTLPPGEVLTIHVGRGTDTWTELFLGLRKGIFENMTRSGHGIGDGAYLFDPQGDLRAWSTYPCRLACADPNAGALALSVDPRGIESVSVTNVGTAPVDLDAYRLFSAPHVYAFPPASVIQPGERLQVDVIGDPDEDDRLLKSWGKAAPIFRAKGDIVRLQSLRGVELECVAWGSRAC